MEKNCNTQLVLLGFLKETVTLLGPFLATVMFLNAINSN